MRKAIIVLTILSGMLLTGCYTTGTTGISFTPLEDVKTDHYGSGVNADKYGRPHTYILQDGTKVSPIFQNKVKRNAYGYGVHQDQFGRSVYDFSR